MNRNLLKQAQQLQAKLAEVHKQLDGQTVEVTAGGGTVTVVSTGKQRILSITIAPEVVDPQDVEMLQDLVMAAVNEALEKSKQTAAEHISSITGGMEIPGLM